MPHDAPQVAHAEDYDSDKNSVKPGTRKEARRRSTASRPPKKLDRYRSAPRDAASDSGYSSYTSGPAMTNNAAIGSTVTAIQAPPRPASAQGTTKSRPVVIQRSSSQRSKNKPSSSSNSQRVNVKATSRSNSTSRQDQQRNQPCGNPSCQEPFCHKPSNVERQPQVAQPYAPQQIATPYQYQQPPSPSPYPYQYHYAQVPQVAVNYAVPTLATQPQPQPRLGNAPRAPRPVSIHGYSYPSTYSSVSQGPPPSASAYHSIRYAAWPQTQESHHPQPQAYQRPVAYAQAPPSPTFAQYPQRSPSMTSPTSPTFSVPPEYHLSYAARAHNAQYEQRQPANISSRPYSARPPPARTSTMPSSFHQDTHESSEADSHSESSASEYSEEEYERDHRSRARDSRLMSSESGRRPSLKRQSATVPMLVRRRSSRDTSRRHRDRDEYVSDNVDSDRTVQAVVDRPRTTYTSSKESSRRPSISTQSSGRTKATTVSGSSGYPVMTVERNGRFMRYQSKQRQEELEYERQQIEDQRREDDVRAYQEDTRGPLARELTLDAIRAHERRRNESHYSEHSRRTSRSSSRNHEATRIESGGAVIHVYPGSTVEMRHGKDGASTLVIGTASGRDSKYHAGSKTSHHRRGSRNYGGSDGSSRREEPIREDDVLEMAAD